MGNMREGETEAGQGRRQGSFCGEGYQKETRRGWGRGRGEQGQ